MLLTCRVWGLRLGFFWFKIFCFAGFPCGSVRFRVLGGWVGNLALKLHFLMGNLFRAASGDWFFDLNLAISIDVVCEFQLHFSRCILQYNF